MNITSIVFNEDGSVAITRETDGVTAIYVDQSTVTPAPVVAPTDTEVDILLSDGTTKKFVPAAPPSANDGPTTPLTA